jgi:type II secretory pathway pseudopilin PulG
MAHHEGRAAVITGAVDRIRHGRARRAATEADGFNMIELIVVVAAVILLSTFVAPRIISWIDDGKAARARGDAAAIAAAMTRFFQDTTLWPGQAEILKTGNAYRFLIVGKPADAIFPTFGVSVGIGATTCTSGLAGVTPNVTAFNDAVPSDSNTLNVLDFLLRKPPAADYPNWHGPYLTIDLSQDAWGRTYVINVLPLFCGETVTATAPGGALGFGWILSGGPNSTIQTRFTDAIPAADSDDEGVNMSKRVTPATP